MLDGPAEFGAHMTQETDLPIEDEPGSWAGGARLRDGTTRPAPVDVFVAPVPFAPRIERLEVPAFGQNIARILAGACNSGALAVDDLERTRVYLNGVDLRELDEAGWLDVVPVAGDVVNVSVLPMGGGGRQGGGNKVLQSILTIAIIAVSFWVGGPAGPLQAYSLLVRAGAAAAVQVAGTLAVNAIFAGNGALSSNTEANQRAALQGSGNNYRLRAPMPLRLGRQRVAFDLAAGAYTQLVGEDVWLKVMFGLHYGPCTLEDVKIGETLLSAYPSSDYQVEYFLTPGARNSQLYPGRVVQGNYQDELEPSENVINATATDAEVIEVDLTWPQGLGYTNDKGKFLEAGAHILVQVQPVGGGAYVPAALPPATGPSGPLPAGSFYVQRATRDTMRQTIRFTPPSKGQWNVAVTKIPNGLAGGSGTLADDVFLTAIRTLEAEKPVADETLSLMVLSIRSSDDLNGQLATVSGIVTPIVPVWNGSAWVEAPSSNSAALMRWLLCGPPAATPLIPEDSIDASIIDALELIDENSWTAAVDVTDEASQEDVMRRLQAAGRFATYWNGQRLCFVPDWSKPYPRQIFTGRNAEGYRYRRTFPDPLHAVIVEFYPLDMTAPADEVIVYADGYEAGTAELFETLRLDFSCDGNRAYREGRAYLAKRELQVEVHEWQAGIDAVAATYGDRVLVRHPSTLYGISEATVDHRRFAGGLVSGLRLDDEVPFEPGKDYGIDIRRADEVLRGVPIVNPGAPTRNISFASPRAVDLCPERGDLVVVGELGEITEDLEVVDIDPTPEGTVTFRGFKYIADALALAETGEIPPFTSGLKPRAQAPTPRIVAANGSPEGVDVTFDIDPVRSALVASFAARWRLSGDNELGDPYPWRTLRALGPGDRNFRTPPPPNATGELDETGEAHPDISVDVEVRSLLKNGAVSPPAQALNISCVRGVPDVENLSATGVTRTSADGSTYPAIQVTAALRIDGIIQDLVVQMKGADDSGDAWINATTLPAAAPFGDLSPVKSGEFYDVRARWRTKDNWVGDWSVINDVFIPEGSWVSYSANRIGGYTPAEFGDVLFEISVVGAELVAKINALGDLDTDGAFVLDYSNVIIEPGVSVAEFTSGVSSRFDDVSATVALEAGTRASADDALAYSISVVSASNATNTASIVVLQSASAALGARYGVVLNSGGRATGFQINNLTGSPTSFIIQVDEFGISDGSTSSYPFSVSGGIVRMTNVEVDTLRANVVYATNIVAGEVTKSAQVVDATSQDLDYMSEITVATLVYTSSGGVLDIDWLATFQGTFGGGGETGVVQNLYVDGGLLSSLPWLCPRNYTDMRSMFSRWQPSAGSHTLEIRAYHAESGIPVRKLTALIRLRENRNG